MGRRNDSTMLPAHGPLATVGWPLRPSRPAGACDDPTSFRRRCTGWSCAVRDRGERSHVPNLYQPQFCSTARGSPHPSSGTGATGSPPRHFGTDDGGVHADIDHFIAARGLDLVRFAKVQCKDDITHEYRRAECDDRGLVPAQVLYVGPAQKQRQQASETRSPTPP